MSDCVRLSDRMPAVALGRSTWTVEESTHLSSCSSCQEEWALVRVAGRLGRDVAAAFASTGTASAVLQRLASNEETILRKRSWTFAALASAAAVAAVIWARPLAPNPSKGVPAVAGLPMPIPELEYLLPAELNAVLQTMDEPYLGGSADDSAAGDSDYEDLEGGLDIWEG
jgi:hypothetical protein